MAQYVTLIHKLTREQKEVKIGFSWVTLFFGFLVPLVRGHFIYFFVLLGLCFVVCGIPISWFVCPFFINKHYYDWLLTQGYMPLDEYNQQVRKEEEDRKFKQAMMAKLASDQNTDTK